jgi:CMD domain protein
MSEDAVDVMDKLAGLAPGSPVAALRRQRPDVVKYTQTSDDAIFSPTDDGGLTRAERAAAALRIATLIGDTGLQEHYRNRLAPLDPDGVLRKAAEGGASAAGNARRAAVFWHVERASSDPGEAKASDLAALRAVGLSPHAIVSLSQVIAFVNFQARVAAALRMLRDAS